MHRLFTMFILALLTVSTARGEDSDSLQIFLQRGDSLMEQYNTYEALKYYQQAFDRAQVQGVTRFSMDDDFSHSRPYVPEDVVPRQIRLKLADCQYKRSNYRETTELLKNMPEDSLTHDAFRQLAYGYKHQGDNGAFMYWASQLLKHYPMDGEVVAGLALAYARDNQPQKGIVCAALYTLKDSTNILVNRAEAEAWLLNGDYSMAGKLYQRLLQQGDSTFSTLYSAGMCYTKTDSLERAYQCLKSALWLSGMKHSGAAWRLGVVSIDTKRYEEGLGYLSLALELMRPDTTAMRAITLSQGEGYYLTEHYVEAVAAWKEHLTYNPTSIATYYNIANAYAFLLNDNKQAESYYRQFLNLARKEEKPTEGLRQMIQKAENTVRKLPHSQ
ncbi:MAG: tetratricopeptide repeat protein [Prevotella sp.]|nr:tetratricopeptide repeat protein [Prevotella sp.]